MNSWQIIRAFFNPLFHLLLVPSIIHQLLEPMAFKNGFSVILGTLLVLIGMAFMTWANVLFVSFAQGTMSSLDAPKKLMVLGPYRYVRNPIAIAIITVLWGEAVLFSSLYLLGWSVLYWVITHTFLILKEEKDLEAKFGEPYVRYRKMVPRWVPLKRAARYQP